MSVKLGKIFDEDRRYKIFFFNYSQIINKNNEKLTGMGIMLNI